MVKDGCPGTLCKRWPTAPAFGDWHGFQRLIAEVGLGKAGLVMSLDASRLARNNRDWHQLLELCSLFGVLIADGERLYDPGAYHDRLLLGLSGIMSEAELHQIKVSAIGRKIPDGRSWRTSAGLLPVKGGIRAQLQGDRSREQQQRHDQQRNSQPVRSVIAREVPFQAILEILDRQLAKLLDARVIAFLAFQQEDIALQDKASQSRSG
jgi:hypothetical protein